MVVVILFSNSIPAFASGNSVLDEEYVGMVAEIMRTYFEDPDEAVEALEEIDTVLLGEPTIACHCSANARGVGTDSADYDLIVYGFKRGTANLHYLQWYLEAKENEWAEGPYDLCSLEWDTAYASYYASSGDGVISTVRGTDTGIVLFNVQDKDLGKGDYTYGTVQVQFKKTGRLFMGSKFTHTFTTLTGSGTVSHQFKSSAEVKSDGSGSLGLDYTRGYVANVGTQISKWEIWDDAWYTVS